MSEKKPFDFEIARETLSGALNRQGPDEAVNREVSGMRCKESPLCGPLLDIDNFKKLNDSKGHATGDEALAHLGPRWCASA